MKYGQWHWPMHVIAFANTFFFNKYGVPAGFAVLLVLYIFIWNVYAYPRSKDMWALPKTGIDVTKNGSGEDRYKTFIATVVIFAIWNVMWVWQYFR